MDSKDRFPLLRKVLKAIGLPEEAIDDIVERILDWLSTKDQPSSTPTELPFKLRDDFLSNAEISFCQVLGSVVGDRAVVCPKVNLGDLFFVATGDHRKNRALANRVDRKHIDFLLCEPKTMRPVVGIELDDRSHDRTDRQARDQLVEAVFNAAGLPLLRFAVRSGYAPAEIESQVMRHFGHQAPAASSPSAPSVPVSAPSDSAPACPKCGSKMILRTAKSGANAGGQFWGCSNFPRCRSVLEYRGGGDFSLKKATSGNA
ncbi:MAG TPA: DUF2726 domain-containing protein [Clostridia bacterium]|nr:DUF2726 domain-containing protein [Clostridia bacterium]